MNISKAYNNSYYKSVYENSIGTNNTISTSSNAKSSKIVQLNQSFVIPEDERLSKLREIFDEKALKRSGVIECSTCANRLYKDDSNDSSVSFKSATHLTPEEATSVVRSHEQEHVANEQAKAKEENREIISQSVQIFSSICPECGKSYVSGGVTKTTSKGISNPYINKNESGNLLDIKL